MPYDRNLIVIGRPFGDSVSIYGVVLYLEIGKKIGKRVVACFFCSKIGSHVS